MYHKAAEAVVKGHPHIDQHIVFDPVLRKNRSAFRSLLKALRHEKYNAIIDVYGKWESNRFVAGLSPSLSIGYYKWYTSWLYTHPVKRVEQSNQGLPLAIEHRLQLLQPLLPNVSMADLDKSPKIFLTSEEKQTAISFLAQHDLLDKKLFMIGVLGSGKRKTYPLPYMARVMDQIARETEGILLLNYIPAQKAEVDALIDLCAPSTRQRVRADVFLPSLRAFLGVLEHCEALIGNEGGAINMAKALQVPTFSIFSPWIPRSGWGIAEEAGLHQSIHPEDLDPQQYVNTSISWRKKNALKLYNLFSPDRWSETLSSYLRQVKR